MLPVSDEPYILFVQTTGSQFSKILNVLVLSKGELFWSSQFLFFMIDVGVVVGVVGVVGVVVGVVWNSKTILLIDFVLWLISTEQNNFEDKNDSDEKIRW